MHAVAAGLLLWARRYQSIVAQSAAANADSATLLAGVGS